jgi:hypothetical protein
MYRSAWVLVAAAFVASCATDYVPPREPPPPGWQGASGFRDLEAPRFAAGVKHAGDTVVSVAIGFARTGILAETVETRSAYNAPRIFPKGSKAYATNYTLIRQNGRRTENLQKDIDPIEWCIVVPDGFDGQKGGSQTGCIFWETAERSRYMDDFTSGGFAFSPMIDNRGSAAGMTGPVPTIIEQPVDFGVSLRRELRVVAVKKDGVTVAQFLSDGTNSRIRGRTSTLSWAKTGEVRMIYIPGESTPSAAPSLPLVVSFKPVAGQPDAVEASVVPFTPVAPAAEAKP